MKKATLHFSSLIISTIAFIIFNISCTRTPLHGSSLSSDWVCRCKWVQNGTTDTIGDFTYSHYASHDSAAYNCMNKDIWARSISGRGFDTSYGCKLQ